MGNLAGSNIQEHQILESGSRYQNTQNHNISMNIFNKYWWGRQFDKVRYFVNPRQKWLTKKIPKSWHDKDGLIEICLFECLVNFVEDEEGKVFHDGYTDPEYNAEALKDPEYLEYVERLKQIQRDIDKCYQYIKVDRPALEKQHEESYPKPLDGSAYGDNFMKMLKTMEPGKSYSSLTCEAEYGMSYEEAYREHNRLEKLIEERDTWTMMKIVEHRGVLWT